MSDFEKRISELPPEKRELLALFLGEKDSGAVWLQGAYTAPRNSREELLATLWREVIGLERVGIDDNFFEIGGDSLHCIQIVSRCRELGLQLTANDLFEHPTIGELAAIAAVVERNADKNGASENAEVSPEIELEPWLAELIAGDDNIEDAYGLSPMQEGMLFQALANPHSGVYFEQGMCRLRGEIEISYFEGAWKEIIKRHPVLRTAFVWEAVPKPIQVVYRNVDLPVEQLDWRQLSGAEHERQLTLYLELNRERAVELNRPPLMRLSFIRLADDAYQVIWGIHHLIHDAWSTFAILREVLAVYEALCAGQNIELKPVRPYRDYLGWLKRQEPSSRSKAESFWREAMRGFAAPTSLAADHITAGRPNRRSERQERRLPGDVSIALNSFARQHRLALSTLTQGAWALSLSRISAQNDVIYGLVVSGRSIELPGADSIVGPLFNTLPFRVSLAPDESVKSFLKRLQSGQSEIQRYEQTSLRDIQEWSGASRGQSLFESVLIFQNVFGDITGAQADFRIENVKSVGYSNIPLTIRVTPRAELGIEVLYDSHRFSASRIEALIEDFSHLLSRMVAEPEAAVGALLGQTVPAPAIKKPLLGSMKSLGELRPKIVRLSSQELLTAGYLNPDHSFPLVLNPAVKDLDMSAWLKENRDYIEGKLLEHGAILFRGFDVGSISEFEQAVRGISPELLEYRERSTPRTQLGGNIYTSTEYPAHQNIAYHNEFSYAYTWPMKICFHCVQPAAEGGETPIADSRRVFQLIAPEIRDRFIERGVMYARNYGAGIDLTWEEAFQTTDRAMVEDYCRNAPMEFEWGENNRLRTRQVRPAVMKHPRTGEMVWFNQAHLFHVSNLADDVRRSMLAALQEDDLTRNAFYGDGSPIEESALDEIRAAYDRASASFPWQKGDVLLLDNMLMAHGRGSFLGARKIVVAMAEPFTLNDKSLNRG
jgi:alpha-ketoglutarate-dependent taurine dioxygenase/aryl carrier-like protein